MPRKRGAGSLQISVFCPSSVKDKREVPILIVTDADLLFGIAAEIARYRIISGMSAPLIVVGIGYGAAFADFARLRTPDLTPPMSSAGANALGALTSFIGEENGNAEDFIDLIVDVLIPDIVRRCPEAANGQRLLFGHSLGGLFVAHVLLSRPTAFTHYLISSPALWWDQFAILARLEGFGSKIKALENRPRVFIDVGSKEQDLPTRVPPGVQMELSALQSLVAASRMVYLSREFADELRKCGLTGVEHVVFKQEDHGTVVPAAITRALTFAFPETLAASGDKIA